jgi:hypothetical protein
MPTDSNSSTKPGLRTLIIFRTVNYCNGTLVGSGLPTMPLVVCVIRLVVVEVGVQRIEDLSVLVEAVNCHLGRILRREVDDDRCHPTRLCAGCQVDNGKIYCSLTNYATWLMLHDCSRLATLQSSIGNDLVSTLINNTTIDN